MPADLEEIVGKFIPCRVRGVRAHTHAIKTVGDEARDTRLGPAALPGRSCLGLRAPEVASLS
jgi:hypothetical protein